MKSIDLIGQRFGKLTVLCLVATGRRRKWLCQCDCGTQKAIETSNLRSGNSTACGACRTPTNGAFRHGHSRKGWSSPTYRSWKAMKARCRDASREGAKYYIDRGISYASEWDDFAAFLSDMGERPAGKTLDRTDNNKGYSKANCRWATPIQQTRNRRVSLVVSREGRTMPLVVWAQELGLSYKVLHNRVIRRGEAMP